MSIKVEIITSSSRASHQEQVDKFLALDNIKVIKTTHKVAVTYNSIAYITFIDYKEVETAPYFVSSMGTVACYPKRG